MLKTDEVALCCAVWTFRSMTGPFSLTFSADSDHGQQLIHYVFQVAHSAVVDHRKGAEFIHAASSI